LWLHEPSVKAAARERLHAVKRQVLHGKAARGKVVHHARAGRRGGNAGGVLHHLFKRSEVLVFQPLARDDGDGLRDFAQRLRAPPDGGGLRGVRAAAFAGCRAVADGFDGLQRGFCRSFLRLLRFLCAGCRQRQHGKRRYCGTGADVPVCAICGGVG